MAESKTIPRTNASFPEYLDFEKLRATGIQHCLSLGRDLWTDFNLHDPGVTILEVLCYALTDLGYRTNLPIADLLARSPQQKAEDQLATGSDGKPFDDNFFTAEQILTCNPVTLLDLRKLLVHVDGVRNAWFQLAEKAERTIYVNDRTAELQFEPPEHLAASVEQLEKSKLTPDGLYEVYLEVDEEPARTEYELHPDTASRHERIKKQVKKLLHQHRNLCEDFLGVHILGKESVAICAEIEITSSAIATEVLSAIYRGLEEFLSPALNFYSLQQMLERGKPIEEIFAGRPLARAGHNKGFIDIDEFRKTELRTVVHASDLYRIIMEVPGVLAVRNLTMGAYVGDKKGNTCEKWTLQLTKDHYQRFDLDRSTIVFYKGQLPRKVDDTEKKAAQQIFQEEKNARAKAALNTDQLDRLVPEGVYRQEMSDYRSIVHEFPPVYGIGDGGIPESAPVERKAQVRQLRAYLLFYDQILANYLSQLANLRELFSIRSDQTLHRVQGAKNRTYFTQRLLDTDGIGIPEIRDLLRNYDSCDDADNSVDPEDYEAYLNVVAESREEYLTRRSRVLDHLLARFAESFTDYVLLMFDVDGQRNDDPRIISDKTAFLEAYPETSRNRGRGFNYTHRRIWNTDNVSGLEHRISHLLGLHGANTGSVKEDETSRARFDRRTLGRVKAIGVPEAWHWNVQIPSVAESPPPDNAPENPPDSPPADSRPVSLTSRIGYSSMDDAREALEEFRVLAQDEGNFIRLYSYSDRKYGFAVVSGNGPTREVVAETSQIWTDPRLRDRYVAQLMQIAIGGSVACEIFEDATQGAFQFDVMGPTGEILLAETQLHPSEQSALEHGRLALESMTFPARLRVTDSGMSDCPYGIELLNGEGRVIARHPRNYADEDECEKERQRIYGLAVDGHLLRDAIQPFWQFRLADIHDEKVDLRSSGSYLTQDDARRAFSDVVERAASLENYRRLDIEGQYSFQIVTADATILALSGRYSTASERNSALRATQFFAESAGVPHRIDFVEGDRLGFVIQNRDEKDLLRGVRTDRVEECVKCFMVEAFLRARDASHYVDIGGEDDGYGFEVRNDEDVLAENPIPYATPELRDDERSACVEFLSTLTIEPVLTPNRFYFQVADASGRVLLRSTQNWAAEELAADAYRNFVPLAQDDANYIRVYDNKKCRRSFAVKEKPRLPNAPSVRNSLATHPHEYSSRHERDEQIAITIALMQTQTLKVATRGSPVSHFFRLVGGGELTSISGFIDESEAAAACNRVFSRLADESAYTIESSGDTFRLVVSDLTGSVRAASAPDMEPALLAMRDNMIALAKESQPLPYSLVNTIAGHRCRLAGPKGFPRLESVGDQVVVGARVGGFGSAALRDRAITDALAFFRDTTAPLPHSILPSGQEFNFEYRVNAELVIQGRAAYAFEAAAAAAAEGFAIRAREENNYRRLDDSEANRFGFKILLPANDGATNDGATNADQGDTHKSCRQLVEQAQDDTNYRRVTSDRSCVHGFELIDEDGRVLARHNGFFSTAEQRDEYIHAIQRLADTEGIHLVEHLLLRPREAGATDYKLLPLGPGCRDETGKLCPVRADQYSFRATVVFPSWPRRFRQIEFRRFVERTIRMEAPAHVYLRICWVDVCQMRAFEKAFAFWLRALARPELHDLPSAQSALIDKLFQLKSVYRPTKLSQTILGQSILGTGADHARHADDS